ncbi:MAG: hypothetical protein IKE53_01000 [Clostridiales bacterium]|nr:hypothetical protein [Clostridiales bacterium]
MLLIKPTSSFSILDWNEPDGAVVGLAIVVALVGAVVVVVDVGTVVAVPVGLGVAVAVTLTVLVDPSAFLIVCVTVCLGAVVGVTLTVSPFGATDSTTEGSVTSVFPFVSPVASVVSIVERTSAISSSSMPSSSISEIIALSSGVMGTLPSGIVSAVSHAANVVRTIIRARINEVILGIFISTTSLIAAFAKNH